MVNIDFFFLSMHSKSFPFSQRLNTTINSFRILQRVETEEKNNPWVHLLSPVARQTTKYSVPFQVHYFIARSFWFTILIYEWMCFDYIQISIG